MKISGKHQVPSTFPAAVSSCKKLNLHIDSDLQHRPSFCKESGRRIRNPARVKRTGAPFGKRSRPETPLLRWKVEEREEDQKDDKISVSRRGDCRRERKGSEVVSARKFAAGLWKLQLPEMVSGGGRNGIQCGENELEFQPGIGSSKAFSSEEKDHVQNPHSLCGMKNGLLCKFEPSFQFSNSAMEGVTKWDPVCMKTSDEGCQIYKQMKRLDQQVSAVSMVSALQTEIEQARVRIRELETECHSSKKKLEHLVRKVGEEKASWRSREHEKIRGFIDDIKAELNRERKNRQRGEIINSKLVNELADAKISVKRLVQDYEKERKDRELIEEVCDELANEIGEDKAEAEALRRESMKIREELEEERKMLQMAEVWREERVQMKLVDAKVALEEKYSQMNKLVANLEIFLRSRGATSDVKEKREEAVLLQKAAASVNIQDMKEFSSEHNPDDTSIIFQDINSGEPNVKEIEPCPSNSSPDSHASKIHTSSPEVSVINKNSGIHRHSNTFTVQKNGEIEEDESGWETVSHLEDQGSSYSPESSAPSVKNHCRSNVSNIWTEWEENSDGETPVTEISEVGSILLKQSKKASTITRLWKSLPKNGESYKIISADGVNGRVSNGRISNGNIISPDRGSGNYGLSSPNWSSPESGKAHVPQGKKGCIPRGTNSLKARLLEARFESQRVQLCHVLKQKI